MSACRVSSFMFLVLLCAKVTVELPGLDFLLISILTGLPTISDLPITTVCFPDVSTLYLFKSSIIPYGVAEIKVGKLSAIFPKLVG